MGESAVRFSEFNSNTTAFPLLLLHQIPLVRYSVFALIAAHIYPRLHGKDVRPLAFFFDSILGPIAYR